MAPEQVANGGDNTEARQAVQIVERFIADWKFWKWIFGVIGGILILVISGVGLTLWHHHAAFAKLEDLPSDVKTQLGDFNKEFKGDMDKVRESLNGLGGRVAVLEKFEQRAVAANDIAERLTALDKVPGEVEKAAKSVADNLTAINTKVGEVKDVTDQIKLINDSVSTAKTEADKVRKIADDIAAVEQRFQKTVAQIDGIVTKLPSLNSAKTLLVVEPLSSKNLVESQPQGDATQFKFSVYISHEGVKARIGEFRVGKVTLVDPDTLMPIQLDGLRIDGIETAPTDAAVSVRFTAVTLDKDKLTGLLESGALMASLECVAI